MENPFRPVYSELTEQQKLAVDTIKEKAMELFETFHILCEDKVDQRCMAVAKTNLEQAVMWAVKASTKAQANDGEQKGSAQSPEA